MSITPGSGEERALIRRMERLERLQKEVLETEELPISTRANADHSSARRPRMAAAEVAGRHTFLSATYPVAITEHRHRFSVRRPYRTGFVDILELGFNDREVLR
jgi:hypothetical protein